MKDAYGFDHASDEVIAVRAELADEVVQALQLAGLPTFRSDHVSEARPGAVVHVHRDADLASAAVSVSWRGDGRLAEAARVAVAAGDLHSPDVRRLGSVGLHMQDSLIRILLSAGIIASLSNDCIDPGDVLVFGRQSELPPGLRPTYVPLSAPVERTGRGSLRGRIHITHDSDEWPEDAVGPFELTPP
ncbi:hypothetical protein [Streptomyces sp. NBC_01013]|uniref:hypothetical protein n=1 Tax=Streptomyces sp. NBC_01013 TaxID=2903718 RepID=UPI00386BF452|nr:hypothetical protein OG538_13425 [Streptomyces sp. NBC_01013]